MSYKTTRVSKALLVMVAFLLPVHIFLIKLTVSALFILKIYISQKTWILYAKIQANRSINKPSMIFFHCACARNIFLWILISRSYNCHKRSSLKISRKSVQNSANYTILCVFGLFFGCPNFDTLTKKTLNFLNFQ